MSEGNVSGLRIVKVRRGWSKTELSKEFNIDRKRIDKLLEHIPANGEVIRGHPTYYVADVARVLGNYADGQSGPTLLGENQIVGYGEDEYHPDRLDSKSRQEWYSGQKLKLQLERETGSLVPAEDVRAALADTFKTIKAFLLTLADVLERDAGIPPAAVERVVAITDRLCDKLAEQLTGQDDVR